MRLGALWGHSQAQLDGFKSRALRATAPTQRHLYTAEWRPIEVTAGLSATVLVISDDKTVQLERLSSGVSIVYDDPDEASADGGAVRPDMCWTCKVGRQCQ